jgi:hypothetical protein
VKHQEFFDTQSELADAELDEARRIIREEGRAATLVVRGRRYRVTAVEDLKRFTAKRKRSTSLR